MPSEDATSGVVTTYLEMRDRGALRIGRVSDGLVAVRVDPPDPVFNAAMYRDVGGPYDWTDRLTWSTADWRRWVEDPEVVTYRLALHDETVGYFELARDLDGSIELAYFGLSAAHVGRGLGGGALGLAIDAAWRRGTHRVFVHTCTLDHPRALANYQARGMVPYRTEVHGRVSAFVS